MIWGERILFAPVLVASELVSVALALVLVFSFLRAYLLERSLYLLGLPLGFFLLGLSYYFLGMHLAYENDAVVSERFFWLRLVTESVGLAFVALTYYLSSNREQFRRFFSPRTLKILALFVAAFAILLLAGFLAGLFSFLELPSAYAVDSGFAVVNLFLLGYVIYHLVRRLKSSSEGVSSSIWAPTAFSILWLGEYSLLIWRTDGSQTSFILAHVARLVSLVFIIRIYWLSGGSDSES
jgi:hypothetical protein